MTVLSRLQDVARTVFEDERIVLERGSTAADIAEWDSVSHISLVLAVEAAFGMRFGTAEIGSLENVGAFVDLIERKMTDAA
ncbi:acyl carrier protein [Methylobacterium dankookense]|uniref:Acyl carrier protein n=1 Tax=Methylobacterium dankookense TaxID=560405 RepID=A0A564G6C3_9HYPH|nr:acyl carrier protein [Methylobacterium dankookense]GJD58633.1 hypothetical protein IFDJLNFL_4555 [Methylobacterium dankookense]VUF16115.1 Acyl carrier protein [Methylobacterium dankookense]